jgi:acyl-CoA thioesterase-1
MPPTPIFSSTAAENPGQSKARLLLAAGLAGASRRARIATLALGAACAAILTSAPPTRAANPPTVAVLGDSLTSGYGLPQNQAFPARLEAALKAKGLDVRVINAGVSGDTSAGGLSRVDWTMADKPDLVIVELGANDALRGIDPKSTEANLDAILAKVKQSGARVLLAGMLAPPNYGRDYDEAFKGIYPRLAAKYDVPLYPFFLDGVAAEPRLNQADGLHPNADGVEVVVQRILPYVEKALAAPGGS